MDQSKSNSQPQTDQSVENSQISADLDLNIDSIDSDSVDWLKKREQARQAMLGEVGQAKEQSRLEELAKRRKQARQAMETLEDRQKREQTEAAQQDQAVKQAKVAELKQKRLAQKIAAQKQIETEAAEKQKSEAAKRQAYLDRLKQSRQQIDRIVESTDSQLSPAKTLITDFAKFKQADEWSLSRIAQTNQETKPVRLDYKAWGVKLGLLLLAIILVGSAGFGLYFTWTIFTGPTPITADPQPLVPVAEHHRIDLPAETEVISRQIRAWRQPVDINTPRQILANIYFTSLINSSTRPGANRNLADLQTTLAAMQINWPAEFTHFLTDNYMIGLSEYSLPRSMFFIFTTRSWDHTFDSLLQNEIRLIQALLAGQDPNWAAQAANLNYVDQIIHNLDVRVGENNLGQAQIFYTFLDRQTLLIAQDRPTLDHLVDSWRQ